MAIYIVQIQQVRIDVVPALLGKMCDELVLQRLAVLVISVVL